MTDITNAILALDPNAEVSVNAEDVNQITWHDGNTNSITVAQIKQNRQNYKRHMMQRLMPEREPLHTHQSLTLWKLTQKKK